MSALALSYYGIQNNEETPEIIISKEDFHRLKDRYANKIKDIWGDLLIVLDDIYIWRSFSLFDYDFYKYDAIELELFYVLSIDKLLFSKIIKNNTLKNRNDIDKIKTYYFENYRNDEYVLYALSNYGKYKENSNIIF